MSNRTLSEYDMTQILQKAFSPGDGGLVGSSFVAAQHGNKITLTQTSLTDVYTFYEGSTSLFVITITYTDSTKATLSQVERTT